MYYARTKLGKIEALKTFCRTQSKNLYAKVWKVSLENTITWELKSSTSSLDLCVPTKHAQITVLEATKMKQKSSMTHGVPKNGPTEKCEKMSTS